MIGDLEPGLPIGGYAPEATLRLIRVRCMSGLGETLLSMLAHTQVWADEHVVGLLISSFCTHGFCIAWRELHCTCCRCGRPQMRRGMSAIVAQLRSGRRSCFRRGHLHSHCAMRAPRACPSAGRCCAERMLTPAACIRCDVHGHADLMQAHRLAHFMGRNLDILDCVAVKANKRMHAMSWHR